MRRAIALAMAAAVIVAGAQLSALLLGARGDLLAAQAALERAAPALVGGDLPGARASVEAAGRAFVRSRQRLAHPVARGAIRIPLLGRNLRAASAMTHAGELIVASGEDLTAALAELPDGAATLAPRAGALPLEAIGALNPALERTRDRLATAAALLRSSPATGLAPPVLAARRDLVQRLDEALAAARTAAALSAVLPTFLGAQGPRRYLFGAQNPAELRGTGGVIGAYSLLTVDRGRLSFGVFTTTGVLNRDDPAAIDGPDADYDARYRRFGAAGHASNVNMTPDFPSAAAALAHLHELATGKAVDGIVVADPQFLSALLRVTGPVDVQGVGRLDAEGVVRFLATDQYAALGDGPGRKEALGVVAGTVLAAFLHGEGEAAPGRAMRELAAAVGAGNLRLWASEPEVQAAFVAAGIAGEIGGQAGDVVGVIANNAAGNKLDAFLQRELSYDVTLRADGSARVHAAVVLSNEGPRRGFPAYVIGPNVEGLAAGDNLTYLSLYCPGECRLDEHRRDGRKAPVSPEREHDLSVFTALLRLPSGTGTQLDYHWEVADAWQPESSGGRYRLALFSQPAIAAVQTQVSVRMPEGMRVADHDSGFSVDGPQVRWEGELSSRVELAVTFDRPPGARLLDAFARPWSGATEDGP